MTDISAARGRLELELDLTGPHSKIVAVEIADLRAVLFPTENKERDRIVADLRRAAESSSRVQKFMSESKSLRNTEGERDDCYMWPTPEQTLEGRAADFIERAL